MIRDVHPGPWIRIRSSFPNPGSRIQGSKSTGSWMIRITAEKIHCTFLLLEDE